MNIRTILTLTAIAASCLSCSDDDAGGSIGVTTITLSDNSLILSIGEMKRIEAYTDAEGSAVEWSTSDAAVATVTDGIVTGKAAGMAIIEARVGSVAEVCTTYVSSAKIELSQSEMELSVGESASLTATVTPNTGQTVTWASSNESVLKVLSSGIVNALAEGSATVTASVGNSQASCTITVSAQKTYKLVWSDEFNGTSLNSDSWNIETGGNGWGNQEKQYYTGRTENLRVADGLLSIELRKEDYEGNNYTSARITTKNKHDFAYGKIEARIKLPSGGGTWPAFWMLGYGSWPYCGEIDIMEHVGNNPTMVSYALHTQKANGNRGNNWSSVKYLDNLEGQWHTFGIEWVENYQSGRDAITFYVDDEYKATKIKESSTSEKDAWPFFNKFYIILNMAIGGNMGGAINDAIFETGEPVVMQVDWVRVYQKQ